MRVGRSLHDDEVLAIDEAARGENGEKGLAALVERTHRGAVGEQPQAIDSALLLCARRERRYRGGAGETQDELATLHSITLVGAL